MVAPLLALGLGVIATLAALRVRRLLVARLGDGYVRRFVLVQGLAINLVFWLVFESTARWAGLTGPGTVPAYGLLFFVYSLSNIDWTARKFHAVE